MALLSVNSLKKSFSLADGKKNIVLDVPEFSFGAGRQMALRGKSGGAETTFFNLIAGAMVPDGGSILIDGRDMAALPQASRDRLRAELIGHICPTFSLFQHSTCLENVRLALASIPGVDNRARAQALLARVGLSHRLHHYPRQLATSQQQRVALARAMANRPKLVLADEPTGFLDHQRAQEALALLQDMCREVQAALLFVSHDPGMLADFEEVRDFSEWNRVAEVARP